MPQSYPLPYDCQHDCHRHWRYFTWTLCRLEWRMQYRDRRVADAIRDTVAEIILNKLSDPALRFVTVTRCHITRDLRNATVFVSVMGDEKQSRTALEHLGHACSYVRRLVGQRLKLKFLPTLSFATDELLLQERRVSEILESLSPAADKAKEAVSSESADPGTAPPEA